MDNLGARVTCKGYMGDVQGSVGLCDTIKLISTSHIHQTSD
jgi:hypothetical protein